MKTIKNKYGMLLEVHSECSTLYHLTSSECLEYIMAKGILPSEYGDIEVNENDGSGVYCIQSLEDIDYLISLAGWLNGVENTQIIEFKTTDKWYVCKDEIYMEDDEELEEEVESDCPPELKPHYGYVVHPNKIPKENIVKTKSLMEFLKEHNIAIVNAR
jgi:hypothetical protein